MLSERGIPSLCVLTLAAASLLRASLLSAESAETRFVLTERLGVDQRAGHVPLRGAEGCLRGRIGARDRALRAGWGTARRC